MRSGWRGLFGIRASPVAARRWANFRANRRGYVSTWVFLALFSVSCFAEFLANDKPLFVSYRGRWYFPVLFEYPETEFGGFLETEADYRDPFVREAIEREGWALWPPIPYSYDTVLYDLPVPAPSPPSRENWLGTDDQARDVLARLLYGFRLSIVFALLLTLASSVVGIAAGAVQGYFGGWVDLLFQRFLEIWSGMPRLYLLIILSSVVTPSFWWLLGLLLLFSWMALVGVVRAEFLRARNFDFVRAARALGVTDRRIIRRHVLPNALVATLTFLPFLTSGAIVQLTALDFLGFGMPPGSPSLGELLKQGKDNLHAPWLGLAGFFSIAVTLTLLVFIGEAVRDALDPRKNPVVATDAVANDAEPLLFSTDGRGGTAPAAADERTLLVVDRLAVRFGEGPGAVDAVRDVSFSVGKGETVALVGESGSGKSVTALSILRLLPYPYARHPSGSVLFGGKDLLRVDEEEIRRIRGNRISMVFQEPMTSLNPLHTIEKQVGEVLRVHKGLSRAEARERVKELLELVGIEDAERRLRAYPHELSGGQRQRVMIAMALANEPDLLVADEPTTAVDVTTQAQLLRLLLDLQRRFGMAVLFITHDLSIVRHMASRVFVLEKGVVVESGEVEEVFRNPRHPYTRRLLASEPKGEPGPLFPASRPVLSCRDLRVWYPVRKGILRRVVDHVRAVDGISLTVREGETLGVVGESGSGKTTLGLAVLRLVSSRGAVEFCGRDIQSLRGRAIRPLRREMQIVFQDPYGSLSPRLSVAQILEEGLLAHGIGRSPEERESLVVAALEEVGLDPDTRHRYPHEFSGGQRQRIAIARAMILSPRLVVLDEPTSALDVSVQAQILELLRKLQEKRGVSYLFISHDLRVVRAVSHSLLVLWQGRAVEYGPASEVFSRPRHEYTRSLLSAAFLEGLGAGSGPSLNSRGLHG
ncbi:MAG: hypothetical protein KatS3mg076_2421 [Candidatus Binatia bacterium]|nr:MAG: hypothetical protein KatS3mg076_2421 [Candidatus Binatia bacterium]